MNETNPWVWVALVFGILLLGIAMNVCAMESFS
jgi:hypothetical protein